MFKLLWIFKTKTLCGSSGPWHLPREAPFTYQFGEISQQLCWPSLPASVPVTLACSLRLVCLILLHGYIPAVSLASVVIREVQRQILGSRSRVHPAQQAGARLNSPLMSPAWETALISGVVDPPSPPPPSFCQSMPTPSTGSSVWQTVRTADAIVWCIWGETIRQKFVYLKRWFYFLNNVFDRQWGVRK